MMAVVDAEGRLFERWNIVDVVVAALLLALVPVGYAAYALFRAPAPRLTAVEPAELVEGPNLRVTIRGINLRPYLRVSFNSTQGATFLFEDSTRAVVDLNAMGPGTYDVILYDFGQERHRLPQALTIKSPASTKPTSEAIVAGRFINLTAAVAATVGRGALSLAGEVIETAPPRPAVPRVFSGGVAIELSTPERLEVPAALQLPCVIRVTQGFPECGGADFPLRPNYVLTIPWPNSPPLAFQIDQIRGIDPARTITVKVRFTGGAEAVALMRPGDLDLQRARNPFALGGSVASLQPPQGTQRSGVIQVRAQKLTEGWWDGVTTLRASAQFVFNAERYSVTATVLSIDGDEGQ